MKRIFKIIFIVICIIIILPIIVYNIYAYQSSFSYKDVLPPNFSRDTTTNKPLYVESPKKLVQSLIASEEYFNGYIKLKYLNPDKVEIAVLNDSTGDDSIGVVEYFIIAEKSTPGWTIVENKIHWKCTDILALDVWRITPCS